MQPAGTNSQDFHAQIPTAIGTGMSFDLRLARHFVVLVEEGSFSAAAKRLFLSQSALTKQIQVLERTFAKDMRFIDRSCRPWRLTPAGYEFLALCRDLLHRASKTVRAEPIPQTAVKIGMVGGDSTSWPFARLVEATPKAIAHDRIDYVMLGRSTGIGALRRGDVDVLLTRPAPMHPDICVNVAYSEARVLAMPKKWDLAKRGLMSVLQAARLPMLHNSALPAEDANFWALGDMRPIAEATLVHTNAVQTVELLNEFAVGAGAITVDATSSRCLDESFVHLQTLRDAPAVETAVCWRVADLRPDIKRAVGAIRAALISSRSDESSLREEFVC